MNLGQIPTNTLYDDGTSGQGNQAAQYEQQNRHHILWISQVRHDTIRNSEEFPRETSLYEPSAEMQATFLPPPLSSPGTANSAVSLNIATVKSPRSPRCTNVFSNAPRCHDFCSLQALLS